MLRVIMVDHSRNCTREEINKTERAYGEEFVMRNYSPEWAGYAVEDDTMRLGAQWLIDVDPTAFLSDLRQPHYTTGRVLTIYDADDSESEEILLGTINY